MAREFVERRLAYGAIAAFESMRGKIGKEIEELRREYNGVIPDDIAQGVHRKIDGLEDLTVIAGNLLGAEYLYFGAKPASVRSSKS